MSFFFAIGRIFLKSKDRFTAAEVCVNAVCDQADLELAGTAQTAAGQTEILRHHKADALDLDIPAVGKIVGGNGHGFHTPLVLHAVLVQLGENGGQCDPFARTNVFDRCVHLDDPPLSLQKDIAQIHMNRIGAALRDQVCRCGTGLGMDYDIALYQHGGVGEGDHVALGVGVGDGLIHQLLPLGLTDMAYKKVQYRAFTAAHTQLGNLPAQSMGVQYDGGPLCGGEEIGDDKVGADHFVNDNVGGAGVGNICGQLREECLQVGGVRGDGHVRGIRVGGPIVERIHIQAVRADQADTVDDDALCPGGGGHRGRGSAGGGVSVGEHDDDFGIA